MDDVPESARRVRDRVTIISHMPNPPMPAKTIAIADDTAFVRDRFKHALESAGHRGIAVKSAAELLAVLKQEATAVDLVLLDLRLPDSPGLDLVRAIRRARNRAPVVLVFSGTIANAGEVKALSALGVAGYINE